jgi:hypothetical protein
MYQYTGLFIYVLFNDAVNSSDCQVLSGNMSNK